MVRIIKSLGSVLSANPTQIPPVSGRYVTQQLWLPSSTTFNQTVVADRVYCLPFFTPVAYAIDTVSLNINLNPAGTARVGVYSHDAVNHKPNAVLATSASIDTSTTGIKTAALATTIPAGWCWIAVTFSSTPRVLAENWSANPWGITDPATTSTMGGLYYARAYDGAFTNPAPALTETFDGPRVYQHVV